MSGLIEELLGALDTVVLESTEDGRFRLLTPTAVWMEHLCEGSAENELFRLEGKSPFLENFLVDAAGHWLSADDALLRSGAWLEEAPAGKSPLEAVAVLRAGRRILVLRMLGEAYEDRVATLQIARDNRLDQERLDAEVHRRTAQIREREEEIAVRLTMAAGVRDHETGAHIRRIGQLSGLVASRLGWSREDIADMRVAAPMHDIGKIGIPDEILLKPARLSPAERTIMERHAEFGARILSSHEIPLLDLARRIALCHHEAWDGSGYPRGIRGEDIPTEARIVTVVDVYDAMTHARPYKPAIQEDETLRSLIEGRGKLFDPELVDVFLDLLPEVREVQQSLPDGAPEIELPIDSL